MTGLRRRFKDFQRCLRSISSFSDGQARVKRWECDDLSSLVVEVTPNNGPYKGGSFCFEIGFPDDFPASVPNVVCISNMYHPNIDTTSDEYNVCLNLFDEWQDTFGLEDCIQGLLFLLHNPNLEDPLSPYFDPSMAEDEFRENVEKFLKGEEIEDADVTFIRNEINEDDDGEDNDEQKKKDKDKDDGAYEGVGVILGKVEAIMTSLPADDVTGDDVIDSRDDDARGEPAKTAEAGERFHAVTAGGQSQSKPLFTQLGPLVTLPGGLDLYLDSGLLICDYIFQKQFKFNALSLPNL